MSRSRVTTVATILLSTTLLAGCADAGPGSRSSAASATPIPILTPTPAAAVQWADGVCSASLALHDSVRAVTAAAQIDPSASAGALDQARAQLTERIRAVQQSAAALRTAVATTPAEAGPELAAAQQELRASADQVRLAVERLKTVAGQVTDAQSTAELTGSLVMLEAALSTATAGLATYLDTLRIALTGSGQLLRDTFEAAPACHQEKAISTSV